MNVEKYINEHQRVGYLLRKCMAANTPQGVGPIHRVPFSIQPIVLIYRNDANCNAILWNYVGVVQ